MLDIQYKVNSIFSRKREIFNACFSGIKDSFSSRLEIDYKYPL